MASSKILALGVLSIFTAPLVQALPQALPRCGDAIYDPKQFTCTGDDPLLCPIVNGENYPGCGAACYDPHMYTYVRSLLRQT